MTSVMPTNLEFRTKTTDRAREVILRSAQVAETYAVVMAGAPIRVQVKPAGAGAPPAWSTSNTISFNEDTLGDLTKPLRMAGFKGLTVHELCHIKFTPRSGSKIATWVRAEGLHKYWNMMEDQRIETLFTALYPSTTAWFKAVIYQHLLETADQFAFAYPLIVGRKYINAQTRATARAMFVDQSMVAELRDIMDAYRTLTFTEVADVETAKPLIARYAELVKQAGLMMPEPPTGGCGASEGAHESSESRPAGKRKQKEAKDRAEGKSEQDDTEVEPLTEKADEDLTDEDFDFGDPSDDFEDDAPEGDSTGADDSDAEDDDLEDEDADGGDADGDSDSSTEDDDLDGDSDSDADGSPTDAPVTDGQTTADGTSAGNPDAMPEALGDLLQGALDNLLDIYAEQLDEDIRRACGELQLTGNRAEAPRPAPWVTGSVSVDARKGAHQFGRALEDLKTSLEPSWDTEVESGRLNIDRFMDDDADFNEMFDRWESGREDAIDIECVILLDRSGSMDNIIGKAYESMWGIKSALDAIGASTTVVTFSNTSELLYSADEKATNNLRNGGCNGGTNPLSALRYAQDVLANSARAVKVAIFITDGEWSDTDKCDEVVDTLRNGGVLTSLAYLTDGIAVDVAKVKGHNAEVVSALSDSSKLFALGKSLVNLAIGRNLGR